MSTPKSSYVPSPRVSPESIPRLAAITAVMAGEKTVSEAARGLGLSRNHFQSILHRAEQQMIEAINLKAGGRPSRAGEVVKLQDELRRLQRQNARLSKQVEATHQLLALAGGLLKGRLRPQSPARQRKRRQTDDPSADTEPDGARERLQQECELMHQLGLKHAQAAHLVGVNAATWRRWRHAPIRALPRRCRGLMHSEQADASAEQLVRRLRGLVGAAALAHSVTGLSRRAAATLKGQVLTRMESERKASLTRVRISEPGLLRGIDAMQFSTKAGLLYALISADGAIPYRTAMVCAAHYDTALVVRAIEQDIRCNGAPLVLRLDRASCQVAPPVVRLLQQHGVLVLHGPAHYPCFYGQLERQNREHRQWMPDTRALSHQAVEDCLREMLECVNTLWRRCTLGWQTAEERWNAREPITVDRAALREEVSARSARIARSLGSRGKSADLAERLAIERTLERRGYLQQLPGGWC